MHARSQAGQRQRHEKKKKKKSQVKIPMLREKEKGKVWVRSDVPPSFRKKSLAPRHIFYHCHYCSLKKKHQVLHISAQGTLSVSLSPMSKLQFQFQLSSVRPSVRQKPPIPKLQSPF